jgi:hypothetical protein
MTPIETLLDKLPGAKKSGNGWSARCPAHEDRKASLSVSVGDDGTALLKCYAGCSLAAVLSAIGLTPKDLFPAKPRQTSSRNGKHKASGQTFATGNAAVAELERRNGKRSALWIYHDAQGEPVGLVVRWDLPDKKKDYRPVSRHADGWHIVAMPEPRPLYRLPELAEAKLVIVTEGEKCADLARTLGFTATTSVGGAVALKKSDWAPLAGKEVWILPDRDSAGSKYTNTVAGILAKLTPAPVVRIVELPGLSDDGDDIEQWIEAHGDAAEPEGLRKEIEALARSVEPWRAEQASNLPAAHAETGAKPPSVAEQLVRLALAHYRFGRTDKDELFAVAHDGPNLAVMLKGGSDALRAKLARLYRAETGRTPGASALTDALNVLAGEALDAEAEPVYLRLAAHEASVVIDLARADGQAVIVRPSGWEVARRSPVLFRRTALTGALPIPIRGGTLAELRDLLNVTDSSWPLIVGFLVAALLPDMPHAILLLSGGQGTGKSCVARFLVLLVDPSAAPLRSEPRDLEQWQIQASGSWAVAIDNLSSIPVWLSDALCKAATGDGLVKRKLYTDGELAVLAFRRVVLLTSIDAGALRGDLGDRLLLVELEEIDKEKRRTEQEMDMLFAQRQGQLLGALLDALAAVLAKLPDVRPARLPRMADFARVLAAADAAAVTNGALDQFDGQQGRIAEEVIDSDPFGSALVDFLRARETWEGTATDLLRSMLPEGDEKLPHGWPKRNGVKGRLKRLTPALAAQGVTVTWEREGSTRERRRLIRLVVRK